MSLVGPPRTSGRDQGARQVCGTTNYYIFSSSDLLESVNETVYRCWIYERADSLVTSHIYLPLTSIIRVLYFILFISQFRRNTGVSKLCKFVF